MNSSQKGGKSKSSKSSSSKSKKGGNFLGSASELFIPTGWESFATAASLLAADHAAAAFRRSRNSSKKQKGGSDLDGHESVEFMDSMLEKMHSSEDDTSSPQSMTGGAKKKSKSKTGAKKTGAKKTGAKKTGAKKAKKSTK